MRRALALIGCAFIALVSLSAAAVAAPGDPASSACTITFNPDPAQVTQGQQVAVDVQVHASPGKYATLFVVGQPGHVGPLATDASGDVVFPQVPLTAPVDVTVGITDSPSSVYPPSDFCTDPFDGTRVADEVVRRSAATSAASLAFTGSSGTPTYVLIGVGALAVGLVIVVAARRRVHAND
jgi:LPXTG-motif cell wall-anchored protein